MQTWLRIISEYNGGINMQQLQADLKLCIHLLLSKDQYSLWFDWVVRCQIFPTAPQHSVLEGLPHPVTGGPRDAEVMPFPIINEERQLCNLQQRHFISHVFLPGEQSLFHTLVAE